MTLTLTDIAEHPDLVTDLKPEERRSLYFQAVTVLGALGPVVCADPAGASEDRILSTAEAAKVLGISASTLSHGAKTTYKALVLWQGRKLGFSARRVQDFIRKRVGQ